jgi:hypothetical protein
MVGNDGKADHSLLTPTGRSFVQRTVAPAEREKESPAHLLVADADVIVERVVVQRVQAEPQRRGGRRTRLPSSRRERREPLERSRSHLFIVHSTRPQLRKPMMPTVSGWPTAVARVV